MATNLHTVKVNVEIPKEFTADEISTIKIAMRRAADIAGEKAIKRALGRKLNRAETPAIPFRPFDPSMRL